jgi:SPP1 family predicted phage head-tail adaptor
MNAGMLREPITFQRATKVSDGAGGYTEAWAAISGAPTQAHVKALSGGERYASERIEAGTKWRITVRYFSGLLESDRVVIRTRSHNIRFINNLELQDRWLVIDLDGGAAV